MFYHNIKFSILKCYIFANLPTPLQKKGGVSRKMPVKISMDR